MIRTFHLLVHWLYLKGIQTLYGQVRVKLSLSDQLMPLAMEFINLPMAVIRGPTWALKKLLGSPELSSTLKMMILYMQPLWGTLMVRRKNGAFTAPPMAENRGNKSYSLMKIPAALILPWIETIQIFLSLLCGKSILIHGD